MLGASHLFPGVRLIHLSDLHLQLDWRKHSWWRTGWRGVPGRFELHALKRLSRFERAHEHVERLLGAALEAKPDRILVTGDLTALGDEHELTLARTLLEPLGDRLVVIPGNHDRYTDAGRRFERVFASHLRSDLPEHADAHGWPYVKLLGARHAFIGLDSTRVQGWTHYFAGRVGPDQLARVRRILDDPRLENRTAIVLSHHGPHGPSGRFDWRESGLLDADELLATLRDRPAVLLHGHSHHRYWHRRDAGHPHRIGGGSSTEGAEPGFWQVDLDDHRTLEAVAGRLLRRGTDEPEARASIRP